VLTSQKELPTELPAAAGISPGISPGNPGIS